MTSAIPLSGGGTRARRAYDERRDLSQMDNPFRRKEERALARFLQTPTEASGGMRSSAGEDPRHRNATNAIESTTPHRDDRSALTRREGRPLLWPHRHRGCCVGQATAERRIAGWSCLDPARRISKVPGAGPRAFPRPGAGRYPDPPASPELQPAPPIGDDVKRAGGRRRSPESAAMSPRPIRGGSSCQ